MDLQLKDRVAAVAAASAGLGFGSAMQLAKEGCKVGICARRAEKLENAANEIRNATGAEVLAIPLDLSQEGEPRRFVREVAGYFGKLDIVVGNAGGPPSGPFEKMSDDQWRDSFNLNFLATSQMFHEALSDVKQSDQGRLIAITSMSAKQPLENLVLSNATRAGVHGLVKTLSREVAADRVTVNAVCPGITNTDRITELARETAEQEGITLEEAYEKRAAAIPMGRLGDKMEFGAAVTYLCSKQAAYISGVALPVDGGFLAGMP